MSIDSKVTFYKPTNTKRNTSEWLVAQCGIQMSLGARKSACHHSSPGAKPTSKLNNTMFTHNISCTHIHTQHSLYTHTENRRNKNTNTKHKTQTAHYTEVLYIAHNTGECGYWGTGTQG